MVRIKFLFVCLFLTLAAISIAQPVSEDLPLVTRCIALVNVNLVPAAGQAARKATVVLRDGIITAVGEGINIPADAYRIEADSFYAYPAFIDAFSNTGIKEEESTPGQGPQNPPGRSVQRPAADEDGNLPLKDAGITPFLSARNSINANEKSISAWREQGFAISHVVPRGKMMPGKGVLLVLSGKDLDEMIWKEDISLFAQWTGAGGSYPSTVIGMMAKWRELYHNASNNVIHQASYETTPSVIRPEYNAAHQALMPVVKKEMPVFFRASNVKDISRALALKEDLGMRMVIADAEQAWYLKDLFKSGTVPLVLSLDLPDDKSESKKEKEKEAKAKPESVPAPDSIKTVAGENPPDDPEKVAFEKRRGESLQQHRAQAATLSNAGVPYSFGTMSVKTADFQKNIRLMMDEGLTADQALSALTLQPAKLLGIEKHAGSIEVGKMANVIISNKPFFEKESAIRYMIVEGDLYEYEVKEKKKKTDKAAETDLTPVLGTWSYVIESPDRKREGTFEFTHEDGEIKGKITSTEITSGNDELEDIVFEDNGLSFTFQFDDNGNIIDLDFDLNLNGETYDGTVNVASFGAFPITGQRISKPE